MHLIDTIQRDFKEQGIDAKNSYLEPSFYCRDYGIQGRLDLFHINQKENKAGYSWRLEGKNFVKHSTFQHCYFVQHYKQNSQTKTGTQGTCLIIYV